MHAGYPKNYKIINHTMHAKYRSSIACARGAAIRGIACIIRVFYAIIFDVNLL